MSQAKPDTMPWISPYLTVRDAESAIDFYQKAFGFQLDENELVKNDEGKVMHASLKHKAGIIMLGPEHAYGGTSQAPVSSKVDPAVGLYVYCDNVDELYQRATEHGAKVKRELEDAFWGDRMCALTDPDGHMWTFATKIA